MTQGCRICAGLRFRADTGLGFGVWGLGLTQVQGVGCRVEGLVSRVRQESHERPPRHQKPQTRREEHRPRPTYDSRFNVPLPSEEGTTCF